MYYLYIYCLYIYFWKLQSAPSTIKTGLGGSALRYAVLPLWITKVVASPSTSERQVSLPSLLCKHCYPGSGSGGSPKESVWRVWVHHCQAQWICGVAPTTHTHLPQWTNTGIFCAKKISNFKDVLSLENRVWLNRHNFVMIKDHGLSFQENASLT